MTALLKAIFVLFAFYFSSSPCIMAENDTGQSVNVRSYHQQGGITAGVVNVGKPKRHVTEQFKQQLLDKLPREKCPVVLNALTEPEPYNFAKEIEAFLKKEGWAVNFVSVMTRSKPLVGQRIKPTKDGKMQIDIGYKE